MLLNGHFDFDKKFTYEIKINNVWKEFIILKKNEYIDGINDITLSRRINELDNEIYGKYFKGCIGYHPSGWWEYITIKKSDLRYKQ